MRPSAGGQRSITVEAIDPSQQTAIARLNNWAKFRAGPRSRGGPLLKNLSRYPDSVLVAGCQRSGTTMLTRLIAGAKNFWRLSLTHDDELDAALILSGQVHVPINDGRYCFQTTYLNNRYQEYGSIGPGQRLIWVLRNPLSVAYSMVYNWRRWGLNELFEDCGIELATSDRHRRFRLPWPLGPSRIEKACLSYAAKTAQIIAIRELVPAHQLLILDYDNVVADPKRWLPQVFEFVGEPFRAEYAVGVRADSVNKALKLSRSERDLVEQHSLPVYERCLRLARP